MQTLGNMIVFGSRHQFPGSVLELCDEVDIKLWTIDEVVERGI